MKTIYIAKAMGNNLIDNAAKARDNAINQWRTSHYNKGSQHAWEIRINAFVDMARMLVVTMDQKAHKLLVHFEGDSLETATYAEIQLVEAKDEDEIIALTSARFKP